ncbi:hypothetical protein ABW19_dt0209654 [Dactylella cylindrospora]|nr:hypothetical protein ABW19_dt0209654 [Dactylella cylindrospora]
MVDLVSAVDVVSSLVDLDTLVGSGVVAGRLDGDGGVFVDSAPGTELVGFADTDGAATGGLVDAGASVLEQESPSPKKHLASEVPESQMEVKSSQKPARAACARRMNAKRSECKRSNMLENEDKGVTEGYP